MRNPLASAVVALLLLGCAGCGGEDAEMPDVENSRLDLALSDIERAGYNPDDVEVVGGGAFGVVDKSNWTVCEQEPATGALIDSPPRLVVERECEGGEVETADALPSEPESIEPTEAETQKESTAGVSPESADGTFEMPALVGENLQDAQDVLQALGSFLLTQTDATGAERFQVLDANWKVCYQDPSPGTKTSFLELVELGAVKLEEMCP